MSKKKILKAQFGIAENFGWRLEDVKKLTMFEYHTLMEYFSEKNRKMKRLSKKAGRRRW